MSEHTLGDWVTVAREDRVGKFFVVSTRAHRTVALVYYAADGDLIAAAPCLLTACEQMIVACQGKVMPVEMLAALDGLKDAVAKAKGQPAPPPAETGPAFIMEHEGKPAGEY